MFVLSSAVITDYDYVFSENGLVAHRNGELIGTQVSLQHIVYVHCFSTNVLSLLLEVLRKDPHLYFAWCRRV